MTESDLAVLVERLDNLKEQVSVSNLDANEWRTKFMDKLNSLPCESRIEATKNIRSEICKTQELVSRILWIGIPSLISLAVVWGALRNDVERIKETSYGYRGIPICGVKAVENGS